MGLVIEIDLIQEGIYIGIGTVENKRLVELDMTLEDGAVFIKDPDKFKEFKKTREEEMVEEGYKKPPSEKTRKMTEESRKRNRKNIKDEIEQGPVLPPNWKGEAT